MSKSGKSRYDRLCEEAGYLDFQDFIRQVKEARPLVDVIQHFGRVDFTTRYSNGNWLAHCPFHDDRNASFSVHNENGWNCKAASCGEKGGDSISFVRRLHNCDFVDALLDIASAAGLPCPDLKGASDQPRPASAPRPKNAKIAPAKARRKAEALPEGHDPTLWPLADPAGEGESRVLAGRVLMWNGKYKKEFESGFDHVYAYRNIYGKPINYVVRRDARRGRDKFIRPITFRSRPFELQAGIEGVPARDVWVMAGFPSGMRRPIYRAERFGAMARDFVNGGFEGAPMILVVEGEKTADAAQRLLDRGAAKPFGRAVALSPQGGSNATQLADWGALMPAMKAMQARMPLRVILWPDADKPKPSSAPDAPHPVDKCLASVIEGIAKGLAFAGVKPEDIPSILDVRYVRPDEDLPAKWDLADAEEEGRPFEWISQRLSEAEPVPPEAFPMAALNGDDADPDPDADPDGGPDGRGPGGGGSGGDRSSSTGRAEGRGIDETSRERRDDPEPAMSTEPAAHDDGIVPFDLTRASASGAETRAAAESGSLSITAIMELGAVDDEVDEEVIGSERVMGLASAAGGGRAAFIPHGGSAPSPAPLPLPLRPNARLDEAAGSGADDLDPETFERELGAAPVEPGPQGDVAPGPGDAAEDDEGDEAPGEFETEDAGAAGRGGGDEDGAGPEEADDAFPWNEIRPLGYVDDKYYFQSAQSGAVLAWKPKDLVKRNLFSLQSRHWWLAHFGHHDRDGRVHVDWDAIADDLMQACHARGRYDPRRVRAQGCWREGREIVVNTGTELFRISHEDPWGDYERTRPQAVEDARNVYITGLSHGAPDLDNALRADSDEIAAFRKIMENIPWRPGSEARSAICLAGWIALAPICGVLDWRPHIWLDGRLGSGKSWVLREVVGRTIGEHAKYLKAGSTESGMRNTLASMAVPVVYDEAESEDERDSKRLADVVALIRHIAGDERSEVIQGVSGGGEARSFRPNSMFLMGSINVNLPKGADASRFARISLGRSLAKDEFWEKLELPVSETLTESFSRRFIGRMVRQAPYYPATLELMTRALVSPAYRFDRRTADVYGALLAGAYLLYEDEPLDDALGDGALAWIETLGADLGQHLKRMARSDAESRYDHNSVAINIFSAHVNVETSNGRFQESVSDLVQAVRDGERGDGRIAADTAEKRLATLGMRVILPGSQIHASHQLHGDEGGVLFARSHPELRRLLEKTQYRESYDSVLEQADGAAAMDRQRFGTMRLKGVYTPFCALAMFDARCSCREDGSEA